MALIDLQSDLSSLKFGDNKPIIRHNMGNTITQASARVDDVKRLAGILTRAPGIKFAFNQALVQKAKIGSAMDGKKTLGGAVLAGVGAAAKAAIGSGLFLTANAGKAGTGFHGINPSVAQSYLIDGPAENPVNDGGGAGGFLNKAIAAVTQVAQAIGAQSANYHAGKEIIGGAQTVSKNYTEPKFKGVGKDQGKSTPIGNYAVGDQVVDGSKLIQRSNKYKELVENGKIDDDQRYLENGKSGLTDKKDIKDNRFKSYYVKGAGDTLQGTKVLKEALGVEDEDIIPFVFNFYTPGQETDRYVYFRAFLDSLSDTYNGSWSGIKYIGRAEEFYTYTGFGRTISFGFKVAAFSKRELRPIYEKLNDLVGSTAPTYGSEGLFMRGTLLKLTIGDYINNQNGFITSVGLSWNTDYQWEIDKKELRVPHVLDVTCEFTPIHSFNPQFGNERLRFLGNNKQQSVQG